MSGCIVAGYRAFRRGLMQNRHVCIAIAREKDRRLPALHGPRVEEGGAVFIKIKTGTGKIEVTQVRWSAGSDKNVREAFCAFGFARP